MSPSPFSQPDLFGDDDQVRAPSPRAIRARAASSKRQRGPQPPGHESAAQVLDAHDDYRVLRRLRPRPVEPAYQLKPGEAVACIVDVETTGLDHRNHEVIELGMVAFVHDAEGRIGPVLGTFGSPQEPHGSHRLFWTLASLMSPDASVIPSLRAAAALGSTPPTMSMLS